MGGTTLLLTRITHIPATNNLLTRDWLKELPLLKKPTITTMMKLLMLIPMHNAMDHLYLPSRDWLKELPLLKKSMVTTTTTMKQGMGRGDWLKEIPMLTLILITVSITRNIQYLHQTADRPSPVLRAYLG